MSLTQIADDQLLSGLVFKWTGLWALNTPYPPNYLVSCDGSVYISLVDQSGSISDTRPNTGVNWRLVWDLFVERGASAASVLVIRQTPSGTVGGGNLAFTLLVDPVANTEQVFLNGILQEPGGEDYSISGRNVTFVTAPETGDRLRVSYVRTS